MMLLQRTIHGASDFHIFKLRRFSSFIMEARSSGRLREAEKGRVLDEASRQRRLRKQLDALQADNYHEDPHANLQWHKDMPKFQDDKQTTAGGTAKKKRRLRAEHGKQRFRKTFQQLVEDELVARPDGPNYVTAQAPPSKLPARHFCAVCGFYSKYNCIQCGARYCSIKCLETHKDTRCLKWTV